MGAWAYINKVRGKKERDRKGGWEEERKSEPEERMGVRAKEGGEGERKWKERSKGKKAVNKKG